MPKKSKRRAKSAPPRVTNLSRGITTGAADQPESASAVAATTGTTVAEAATRRRVARVDPSSAARLRGGTALADFAPLDPADAAIPFDHVPYAPADLRRVAIIAAVMVLVIIIAAVIVPRIVGS